MEMDDFGWESSPVTDYEIGFPLKTGDNSYSNYGGLDLAEALFRHAEPRKMEGPALPSMDTARWLATVLGASSTTIVHPNPPLGDQLCINVQDEEEEMPSILSGSEIFPNTSSSGSASSGESENYPDVALQGLPQNIQSLKRKDRESGYAMGAPLRKETGFRINFERQARFDFRLHNGYEPDVEAIAQVKEMIYRAAAMRPINSGTLKSVEKPKRKNVKISSDPQTVAARQRRERISERLRVLQSLVPGGSKMDTASMLDEAANYLKFLKSQVNALKTLGPLSSSLPPASLFDRSFAQMQMGPPNVP